MQVHRAATLKVVRARANEPATEAAELMKFNDVGMVVIVDDEDQVLGVVTDRDIAMEIVADGLDPKTPLESIMSHPAIWIFEDAEIEDAVQLMARQGIRRVVVMNHRHQATGVLSIDDLALFSLGDQTVGRLLEKVAKKPLGEPYSSPAYGLDETVFP